jgi:nucleoside-diphosphate-sugar epimerase
MASMAYFSLRDPSRELPLAEVRKMKVAVTGGAGRLGQHIVAELAASGHGVVSVDKTPPTDTAAVDADAGAQVVRLMADLTDVGQA